jgi:hypothetical protein
MGWNFNLRHHGELLHQSHQPTPALRIGTVFSFGRVARFHRATKAGCVLGIWD